MKKRDLPFIVIRLKHCRCCDRDLKREATSFAENPFCSNCTSRNLRVEAEKGERSVEEKRGYWVVKDPQRQIQDA